MKGWIQKKGGSVFSPYGACLINYLPLSHDKKIPNDIIGIRLVRCANTIGGQYDSV